MNRANCLIGMPCIIHEPFHLSWYNKIDTKTESLNVKKLLMIGLLHLGGSVKKMFK